LISQSDIREALNEFRLFELLISLSAREIQKGAHFSQALQANQEFSNYRSYEPGDDLRFVDWKLFARSDKYYLRQNEQMKRRAISIEIDTSKSMLHRENQLMKIEFAKVVAGVLTQMAYQQGDEFAILSSDSNNSRSSSIPKVKSGRRHFHESLQTVFDLVTDKDKHSQKEGGDREDLPFKIQATASSQLHLYISDMHRVDERTKQRLSSFSNADRQVQIFRILGPMEMGETSVQQFELRDWETKQQRSWTEKDLEQFRKSVNNRLKEERIYWGKYGIDVHLFRLNDNPIEQMKEWLKTRHKSRVF